MKVTEMFPSKYMRASDLENGEKIRAEISHTEMRVIGRDAGVTKPVLVFFGALPIILNLTNARKLAEAFGADSRDWAGQFVELSAQDGQMDDGKPYRTIIVTPLDPVTAEERAAALEVARKAEAEAKEAAEVMAKEREKRKPALAGAKRDDDDEIPF